ncbi:hypothetical protein LCGC14_0444220 [marine sediment metagenome]|uniref:Uncharacterized protein n=1 Tax=marine sediment metagenome TaxID=412755 RepID=A0A0F9VTN6_9ZZZZ
MTETKWESWEDLNNLPDDKKKDLILWMLTTQDELVNEVEQEHQQEIQMKKLMNENEELRKTLKNERSKATRAQNKLTKQIEEMSGNPATEAVDPSNDSTPAPIAEAAPQTPAPERKKRKARTVKTTSADLPAAAPTEEDVDFRTLDQVPVNEQQPVRAGAAKMTIIKLQNAINSTDLTPWHRQIAEQEIQRREKPEEIEETPGTTAPAPAPTPAPTNGTAPLVGIKERVLSMMTPGARHGFNDLMAMANQNGIAENDFIGAITELQTEGTVDFPEAEMVTRLQ